ncbi:MAG TPA: hypothetical protein V6D05_08540 [Stenomitos sp.]
MGGTEFWLAIAFGAGALLGASFGIVLMAVLMVSKESELQLAHQQDSPPGVGRYGWY